jgi:hypothetical protein
MRQPVARNRAAQSPAHSSAHIRRNAARKRGRDPATVAAQTLQSRGAGRASQNMRA